MGHPYYLVEQPMLRLRERAGQAGRVAPPRSALAPLRIMGLGWVVVLTLVVGVVGGLWLDGVLGTSPWLTIVGAVFGLLGAYLGGRSLVRESREL